MASRLSRNRGNPRSTAEVLHDQPVPPPPGRKRRIAPRAARKTPTARPADACTPAVARGEMHRVYLALSDPRPGIPKRNLSWSTPFRYQPGSRPAYFLSDTAPPSPGMQFLCRAGSRWNPQPELRRSRRTPVANASWRVVVARRCADRHSPAANWQRLGSARREALHHRVNLMGYAKRLACARGNRLRTPREDTRTSAPDPGTAHATHRVPGWSLRWILAQVSRRVTVRLNTGRPGWESLTSATK